MKEKTTYSSDLKYFFDLCNRANSNNSVAQFDLAKLYLHINRENTNKKAFLLLKKLANQSYNAVQTNAQYMLARCYEKGYGITKNYKQSAKWYRQAYINANNDIYKAFENEIGDIIDEALNEPESEEITPELIDCVTENAENGDSASQEYLANLYWRGNENIKANDKKFVYWADKAARQGDYILNPLAILSVESFKNKEEADAILSSLETGYKRQWVLAKYALEKVGFNYEEACEIIKRENLYSYKIERQYFDGALNYIKEQEN